jgi:hypothetical protein
MPGRRHLVIVGLVVVARHTCLRPPPRAGAGSGRRGRRCRVPPAPCPAVATIRNGPAG